jgi:hypothetical protein
VTDSEGRSLDYAANFAVAARLKVGTLALSPGKVGRSYRSKVTALGGVAPRKWKITVGPLPKGIRFDRTTGILSGIPTKAGRYRLTFQVTDGLRSSHRSACASTSFRSTCLPSVGLVGGSERESHGPCGTADASTTDDRDRGLRRHPAGRRPPGSRHRDAQLSRS